MTTHDKNALALKILRLKDVIERTGVSKSNIYNKLNPDSKYYDVNFPKQNKLGIGAVGWLESEVDAWIAGQFASNEAVLPMSSVKRLSSSSRKKSLSVDHGNQAPAAPLDPPMPQSPSFSNSEQNPVGLPLVVRKRKRERTLLNHDGTLYSKP